MDISSLLMGNGTTGTPGGKLLPLQEDACTSPCSDDTLLRPQPQQYMFISGKNDGRNEIEPVDLARNQLPLLSMPYGLTGESQQMSSLMALAKRSDHHDEAIPGAIPIGWGSNRLEERVGLGVTKKRARPDSDLCKFIDHHGSNTPSLAHNSPLQFVDETKPTKQGSDKPKRPKRAPEVILHADGASWRKYGEKVILAQTKPTQRCYFRCSTSGCPAKKSMQWTTGGNREDMVSTFTGTHNHVISEMRRHTPKHSVVVKEPMQVAQALVVSSGEPVQT